MAVSVHGGLDVVGVTVLHFLNVFGGQKQLKLK